MSGLGGLNKSANGVVIGLVPLFAFGIWAFGSPVRLAYSGAAIDPTAGQPGWEVAPPYGTDMIIAVASSQPLFTRPRSGNVELAATYLRDLDAAVQAIREGGGKLVGNALLVDALAK